MRLNIDDGSDIGVDMGPLIDCVFLLLIFFLVSTTMKKPEMEMPVDLPDPAISAQAQPAMNVTVLTIDREGSFYMKGVPIGQTELHRQIREIGQTAPETRLRIDVHREAPSRFLVQMLDLCSFEGLRNYRIHTRSPDVDRKQ